MDSNNKINVGLYIGQGPKPSNVNADMYVDMTGKSVGVYINGGAVNLKEEFEKAIDENPSSQELKDIYAEYQVRGNNPKDLESVYKKIIDFGKKNAGNLIGSANLLFNIANKYFGE